MLPRSDARPEVGARRESNSCDPSWHHQGLVVARGAREHRHLEHRVERDDAGTHGVDLAVLMKADTRSRERLAATDVAQALEVRTEVVSGNPALAICLFDVDRLRRARKWLERLEGRRGTPLVAARGVTDPRRIGIGGREDGDRPVQLVHHRAKTSRHGRIEDERALEGDVRELDGVGSQDSRSGGAHGLDEAGPRQEQLTSDAVTLEPRQHPRQDPRRGHQPVSRSRFA